MRRLPPWQRVPPLYRLLVILFAAVDLAVLAIAAAGLRSWFHGGLSVVKSLVYLLLLTAFFVHIPPGEPLLLNQRLGGTSSSATGIAILFLSAGLLIGGAVGFVPGVQLLGSILEVAVFTMFLSQMAEL